MRRCTPAAARAVGNPRWRSSCGGGTPTARPPRNAVRRGYGRSYGRTAAASDKQCRRLAAMPVCQGHHAITERGVTVGFRLIAQCRRAHPNDRQGVVLARAAHDQRPHQVSPTWCGYQCSRKASRVTSFSTTASAKSISADHFRHQAPSAALRPRRSCRQSRDATSSSSPLKTHAPIEVLHRHAGIDLTQEPDHLCFREPFLHRPTRLD